MTVAGWGHAACWIRSVRLPKAVAPGPLCVCVCVCVVGGIIHEEGSESQQEQLGVVTALNSLFGSGPCYCGLSVHLIMPSLGGR